MAQSFVTAKPAAGSQAPTETGPHFAESFATAKQAPRPAAHTTADVSTYESTLVSASCSHKTNHHAQLRFVVTVTCLHASLSALHLVIGILDSTKVAVCLVHVRLPTSAVKVSASHLDRYPPVLPL